ncbi:MAG: sulfotransferase [Candidatus Paceibacterota bacterium]
MENNLRTDEYKRDAALESIIKILNQQLEDDERELVQNFTEPKFPILYIVGNARSGSTIMYQWLASSGLFTYPSNIMSRFYKAPYIGALIHRMFVDLDLHGEIMGGSKITFESKLGKTKGPVSPHEFWYFWRRFFDFGEIQKLSDNDLQQVDKEMFKRELAALEGIFNKPLLLKGMMLNWNLNYLNEIMPASLFLHIRRNEIFNMYSLYKARIKFFGNTAEWYSFKPPEYHTLVKCDIYTQLAGQIVCTNNAVQEQLKLMPHEQKLQIEFESFCSKPADVFALVMEKYKAQGFTWEKKYDGPESFTCTKNIDDKDFNIQKAEIALKKIKDEYK